MVRYRVPWEVVPCLFFSPAPVCTGARPKVTAKYRSSQMRVFSSVSSYFVRGLLIPGLFFFAGGVASEMSRTDRQFISPPFVIGTSRASHQSLTPGFLNQKVFLSSRKMSPGKKSVCDSVFLIFVPRGCAGTKLMIPTACSSEGPPHQGPYTELAMFAFNAQRWRPAPPSRCQRCVWVSAPDVVVSNGMMLNDFLWFLWFNLRFSRKDWTERNIMTISEMWNEA